MKKLNSFTDKASIVFVVIGWLVYASNSYAQPSATNLPSPPVGFVTRLDYLKSFTNEDDAMRAYRKGLISKNEVMMAHLLIGNMKQQDFYGKVIDQYGQPVAGANVTGYLESDEGFGINDEKIEEFKTLTDAQGLFQFTGVRGARFGQKVSKDGYEMGEGAGVYIQPNSEDITSPMERATFIMWKLRGAEPMIHDQKFYGITPNGSASTIDLVNKKKIEGTNAPGDLLVQIQRPAQIKLNEKFDWSFKMTAVGGGVIEVTNISYLNEAPESGYQPSYEVNMSATDPNWQEQIEKTFYLKSRNGQVYGHFHITVIPNYNNTSVFKIKSYINPAGSRTLEFDYKKQIR